MKTGILINIQALIFSMLILSVLAFFVVGAY